MTMARAGRLCENHPTIRINPAAQTPSEEIFTMDLSGIIEYARTAAQSVGGEISSPWFYLQFGLMLVAGGIAFAADRALRSRVETSSLALRWPLPLRHLAHVLVGSFSTFVFA